MGRKKKVLEKVLDNGVLTWFDTLMLEYKEAGSQSRLRTIKGVRSRFASFLQWTGKTDIALDALDARLLAMYEVWLGSQKVGKSTSVYYLRNMYTFFNIARKRGMKVGVNPGENLFGEVYMKIDPKKEKPAVGKEVVQKLQELDIVKAYAATGQRAHTKYFKHTCEMLARARDLFLFRVCAQGMEFIDMCYLKKEDVRDGVIHFVRRMTNMPVEVKVLPMMQEIIDKHSDKDSPYLLDVLTSTVPDKMFAEYRNESVKQQRSLRQLSRFMKLEQPLHHSTARDIWALASYNSGASLAFMAKAMGYASEAGAARYIYSLKGIKDSSSNENVVNAIFS